MNAPCRSGFSLAFNRHPTLRFIVPERMKYWLRCPWLAEKNERRSQSERRRPASSEETFSGAPATTKRRRVSTLEGGQAEGEGIGKLTLEGLEVGKVEQRLHQVVDAVLVEVGEERFRDGSVLLRSSGEGL